MTSMPAFAGFRRCFDCFFGKFFRCRSRLLFCGTPCLQILHNLFCPLNIRFLRVLNTASQEQNYCAAYLYKVDTPTWAFVNAQLGNSLADWLHIPDSPLQPFDVLRNDRFVNRITNVCDPIPEFLEAFDQLHGLL
jgi:hypothetical protein